MVPRGLSDFLPCATPEAWLEAAAQVPLLLLLDHAHCERKAAATALALIQRYPDRPQLVARMTRLAREELVHFAQVVALLEARGGAFGPLRASRYAAGLRELVRDREPGRLVDLLVVSAFIEARSCERFAALAPRLDGELAEYYRGLVGAEARHFRDYLELAEAVSDGDLAARLAVFAERERSLVETPDSLLRFHSGPPARASA